MNNSYSVMFYEFITVYGVVAARHLPVVVVVPPTAVAPHPRGDGHGTV